LIAAIIIIISKNNWAYNKWKIAIRGHLSISFPRNMISLEIKKWFSKNANGYWWLGRRL